MNEEAVFKRYDVRGKYPEEIDESFAEKMGKAVGTFAVRNYNPQIVVAKDTKRSSEKLKQALIKGILSTGCEVLDAGTGPTDYAAFTGKENNSISVQVTSSHLPLTFNGLKFMYPEGNGFTNPDLNRLKNIFREEDFEKGEASCLEPDSTHGNYKKQLKKFLDDFDTDFDKKIVVDTLGGATHPLLIDLLQDLGAEVIDLAENEEEKPYRDPPNPKPEMLDELETKVLEDKADLGIALDMDGDRVTVYKDGFLPGNQVFGVYAQLVDSDIVASIDTSKAVEQTAKLDGRSVKYTRVGDPFVMDKAIEDNVKLAGEPNGHYAFLDFVPYPSGTLSGILAAGIDLDKLTDRIPKYYTEQRNIEVDNKKQKLEDVKDQILDCFEIISEIDGVKFKDEDAKVLARTSGSSSKIRILSESKNSGTAEEAADRAEKLIRNA